MGLFSRSTATEAVHARVADGEHLWLAVRGASSLTLVRDGGPDIDVDAATETHGDDVLLTAVVPLAQALAADASPDLELRLCHGRRRQPVAAAWEPRPASPTFEAPTTADRRWQLSVHDVDGQVVVRRSPAAPVAAVLAVSAVDRGVAVRLAGTPTQVTVAGTTLPVSDGVFVIEAVPDLPAETNVPFEADGVAVARARNVVQRPHYATTLPALPEPEVELRWLRDGRLALFRPEPAPARPSA